jgi:lipoyl(octanoyl) transferase
MQKVAFKDLGKMDYRTAWDYQELLLQQNVAVKTLLRQKETANDHTAASINTPADEAQEVIESVSGQRSTVNVESSTVDCQPSTVNRPPSTVNGQRSTVNAATTSHHLLFVEHPPVYTLGKSGHEENILITEAEREKLCIEYFKTNRGGDITFHGPGQVVGYPILDLEQFYTDIGKYLRNLEEVIILTMKDYGLTGERSPGETGVWLDVGSRDKARKICAMGVRCSRWITMHGFAFNVNTNLDYFNYIIPCGIKDKAVTSMEKELGRKLSMEEVKENLMRRFEEVFHVQLV